MSRSAIVTVHNEAAHVADLLRSLRGEVDEVILVDAESSDDTVAVAKEAEGPPLHVIVAPCSRGAGRNLGAKVANGDLLCFVDGDCRVTPGWGEALQRASASGHIAAGQTVHVGPPQFKLPRVPLTVAGTDVTWPSCNLAYPAAIFHALGGFDESFVTAEDIDLNLRAVKAGHRIVHAPDAIVRARLRGSWRSFARQSFWYGAGRRDLQRKHPDLPRMAVGKTLRDHASPAGITRLSAAGAGYLLRRP